MAAAAAVDKERVRVAAAAAADEERARMAATAAADEERARMAAAVARDEKRARVLVFIAAMNRGTSFWAAIAEANEGRARSTECCTMRCELSKRAREVIRARTAGSPDAALEANCVERRARFVAICDDWCDSCLKRGWDYNFLLPRSTPPA